MITRRHTSALFVAFVMMAATVGCSSDDEGDLLQPPTEVRATCQGCHTDEAMLKATVEPVAPNPESTGEG